ncbi:ribosome quality control complex subunit TCF25 isoform X1 [Scleropages formosus]|uniref:Transcription factor 25 (basic helix-loop-helix) n=1 Tax=Scleropages formosus TaxID=113540 RepID=A0A8C9R6W5_SCLFO|nr:transcription factor 25 isoform X1 [Scleropages formosus]
MSSRALRRLRGKQRGQEAIDIGGLLADPNEEVADLEEEAQDGVLQPVAKNSRKSSKKNKTQKNVNNIYELICDADNETERCPTDEEAGVRLGEPEDQENKEKSDIGQTEKAPRLVESSIDKVNSGDKTSKRKKKKKKKKATAEDPQQEEGVGDDLDALLETIEKTNGLSHQSGPCGTSDNRPVLYVEHRNLNPETELKRYFGARAVLGDQRARTRQRQFHRSTWMTAPKDTWPRFSRPGISMSLQESREGLQYFTFVHNRDYQQVQFKFLDAVESMDPNNIVALLQLNPYHVDSLLQLSDVCRIQEDQEMARDLVERALYSFECAFHPVFSLTSGTSRLDYLRPENRAFYLALYKHMMFLEKRGCPRTALEYCKLILSLDPENDPLCMLLMVDFLSLRSREYTFLIRLYEEWEGHRNLSQLPNFALSVALSYYHQSLQDELTPEECARLKQKADDLLQDALIMFPGVLMPLLDLCAVQPDSAVSSHSFFGPKSQIWQPPALNELLSLYVGRCHILWKEGRVLLWLEGNVREVLRRVDSKDPLVEDYENKRKIRYQSAPRNIHRHVILSEIKGATAALPLEVTTQPVMGFDPLPPLDSVISYTRPNRSNAGASNESSFSLFFRSLLPNFNLQGGARPNDDQEVARAGRELNQEVNRLMAAMRDMLANIQVLEAPREDEPERDEEEWD